VPEKTTELKKPIQKNSQLIKPSKPKGILSTAQNAEEVGRGNYRINALLVGPSGNGKTQSALSMPGRKLLIDYDGRWEVAVGQPDVEIIKLYDPDPDSPKGWLDAEKLKVELWRAARNKKEPFPYDVIIEAGLTSMLKYAMNWSLTLAGKHGLGGSPAMHHYGPQMHNVEQHVRSMKQLPCSYVLEAHVEYLEVEELSDVLFLPKATGKMRTAIPGWFNECYQCYSDKKKDGKVHYYWNTSGTGKWDFLKSTLNNLGKYWDDPIEIDFNSEPVGFAKLLDLRFGKEADNAPN
jgi:hypothetical protein